MAREHNLNHRKIKAKVKLKSSCLLSAFLVCLILLCAVSLTSVHLLGRQQQQHGKPEQPPPLQRPVRGAITRKESSLCEERRERTNVTTTDVDTAALCCIVRHEEAYLDEWVDYHVALGFKTIYVYDNSPRNDLRDFGRTKNCQVQVVHYPGDQLTGLQDFAYEDCAQMAKPSHRWAAFFDADEYLILKKHGNVTDLLHEHCQSGSLGLNWRVFGTSNHTIYAPIPVTRRFLYRLPDTDPENLHIKTIAHLPDYVKTINPHHAQVREGTFQTDTNGKAFSGSRNYDQPYDVAMIHHYRTKSANEYIAKRKRGYVNGVDEKVREEMLNEALDFRGSAGSVFDDSGWKAMTHYVPRYKFFDEA